MEQQTPTPSQVKDEAAQKPKRAISYPWFSDEGGGGINLPSILSKIVGQNVFCDVGYVWITDIFCLFVCFAFLF